MKFSYHWIRELVEGLETGPKDLARLITMKTAECEGVEEAGGHLEAVCEARLVEVSPIPGSHNRRVEIESARHGRRVVVCGAPNARPGLKSVYVPPGTKLGGRTIGRATIDGVESEGMLASGAELGIDRDDAGIVELDGAFDLRPDWLIEVDNKSLTHRPDLWGHYGMAREVAAITGRPLRDPVDMSGLPAGDAPVKVAIQDGALCPRYNALVIEDVRVGPSPAWLRWRLESLGLNPINNVVDVTNFVMAELAQPMHAFDAGRIQGDTIFVRRAKAGEEMAALNGEAYTLGESNLVIADAAGPIAIAGVIGGRDSAIQDGTRRIVLESATFQAASVRRTSSQLKLRTDASIRFEKAQDPANTVRGLARAVELLRQVSPGIRVVGGVAEGGGAPAAAEPIDLPVEWVEKKLGRSLGAERVAGILGALGFGVSQAGGDRLRVSIPSWRATKDITGKHDLVEEIGRIVGYDAIEPRAPVVAVQPPPSQPGRALLRRLRAMAAAQGFTEVYNYSFVNEDMIAPFGFDPGSHLRVLNPIAAGQTLLRTSLLPGLVRNLELNARNYASFRLFEIGREVHRGEAGGLPEEIPHLAAAIASRDDGEAGLFELKRLAECLAPGCGIEPAEALAFEHPHRSARVTMGGKALGRLFELHPSAGLECRAAILDLDLSEWEEATARPVQYRPLRRYPTSAFDLSVVAGARTAASAVQNELAALAGQHLVQIEYLRQFDLGEGLRSLSFRLTVGAADRTLQPEEVPAIRNGIIEGMRSRGYDLRV